METGVALVHASKIVRMSIIAGCLTGHRTNALLNFVTIRTTCAKTQGANGTNREGTTFATTLVRGTTALLGKGLGKVMGLRPILGNRTKAISAGRRYTYGMLLGRHNSLDRSEPDCPTNLQCVNNLKLKRFLKF